MKNFIIYMFLFFSFTEIQAQENPKVPQAGELLWKVSTKSPSYGSGAIGDIDGDGKPEVVFGTYFNDEHIYAVNGEDGSILWKFRSEGGPFDNSILIYDVNSDGKLEVIFGDSSTGTLFCLNGKGEKVWTFKGQSSTDSPAAAVDLDGDGTIEVIYGTMTTRDRQGRVNVLSGKTGTLIWTAKVPGHVQSEPGIVDLNQDGTLDVLVTNWMGDGKLRAFNGKDGTILWMFNTDDWIYHGVSFFDFNQDQKPEIVIADRKGNVWLLKGETGEKIWTAKLEGERKGSVFGPTSLVDINKDGIPEIVICGHHLHLLDAKGKILWRKEMGGGSIARGVAVSDLDADGQPDLIFGHRSILYVVKATDGATIWKKDFKVGKHWAEGINNGPLVTDLDGDGYLDIFIVGGKGTSDKTRPENYGYGVALRGGIGTKKNGTWLRFRGNVYHQGISTMPKKKSF